MATGEEGAAALATPAEVLDAVARFAPTEDGNWLALDALLDRLWCLGGPDADALPVLFGVFERFPEDDGAGVLWSVLHGVEDFEPGFYEAALRASVARVPSLMGTTMLRRLERSRARGDGTSA